MDTQSHVALVTGASRGIGAGIARYLAAQGFIVVGTATSVAGAERICASLSEYNNDSLGMRVDVCDDESIKALFAELKATVGLPTVLVNNAGITNDGIFLRMKEDQWSSVIDTNLTALYRVTKLAVKHMLRQRYGRIINISSVCAHMGNPGQANYCAAKAGMVGFTTSIALELATCGITANVVSPGFIDTDMTRSLTDEQRERVTANIPMQAIGDIDDIAHAVSFLASKESKYMTGQTLHVNGGMHMV